MREFVKCEENRGDKVIDRGTPSRALAVVIWPQYGCGTDVTFPCFVTSREAVNSTISRLTLGSPPASDFGDPPDAFEGTWIKTLSSLVGKCILASGKINPKSS